VAETKSTQTGSGSSPARAGGFNSNNKNREQGRRGTAIGGGTGGRSRGGAAVTTGANPPRQPLPLAGAGGRRGRGNPINFVRDVRSELRKVAWPTQRETVNLTAVVIALSVAVGLFLGGTDFVFQELFRFLLGIQNGGGI
jgi:preprotein translocase subunit SecE